MLTKHDEKSTEFLDAMNILSYWRWIHEVPLNNAFNVIQEVWKEIDPNIVYAKRLKRYVSIKSKLKKIRSMDLWRMYDIWWCRMIVTNNKKLNKIVKLLRRNPHFLDEGGKNEVKDYIKGETDSWYRSYHIIWRFLDINNTYRKIEVQVRTSLQHDRATALEIVDIFTKQSLKSNDWEKEWYDFFYNISKLFAFIESLHLFNVKDSRSRNDFIEWIMKDNDLMKSYQLTILAIKKLNIIQRFDAFTGSINLVNDKIIPENNAWYILIKINLNEKTLSITSFNSDNSIIAEKKYTEEEKKSVDNNNLIIALISTTKFWEIRHAYKNYFADSTNFIKHLQFINFAHKYMVHPN